jgi:putative sterol carrier protein
MDAVNASKAYEDAAKTWEGDFYFIFETGGAIKNPVYQYMDFWHGKCRKVDVITEAEKDKYKPEFVLSAPIATWRGVVEKKIEPINGVVTRQLKLTGNLGKVMRAVTAAQELVNCATQVKTVYP